MLELLRMLREQRCGGGSARVREGQIQSQDKEWGYLDNQRRLTPRSVSHNEIEQDVFPVHMFV